MKNLYLDLQVDQSTPTTAVAETLMELQQTNPDLVREVEDILLKPERRLVYDAVDTQLHAIAHIHDSLNLSELPPEQTYIDTHHWSKRLVEFQN